MWQNIWLYYFSYCHRINISNKNIFWDKLYILGCQIRLEIQIHVQCTWDVTKFTKIKGKIENIKETLQTPCVKMCDYQADWMGLDKPVHSKIDTIYRKILD